MKKFLTILLAFFMVFSLTACSSKPESKNRLEEIKERGYIIIGTEGDWSPWTYYDEAGNLTGFDVEIGRLIAEQLGVEARFEEAAFSDLLAGVQSGRFDLICNCVAYTEERAKSLTFSDPYVYSRKVLIVGIDNDEITTFEDLNGKTTGNSDGSTYAALGEQYGATVLSIDKFAETVLALEQGRIDATINSELSYVDYIIQHPDAPIKIVAESDLTSVCYPANLGEVELIEAVNAALQVLRDNGRLASLSVQFLGKDITNK